MELSVQFFAALKKLKNRFFQIDEMAEGTQQDYYTTDRSAPARSYATRKPALVWNIQNREPAVCTTVCDQEWICSEQITLENCVITIAAGNKTLSLDADRNPASKQLSDFLLRKRYA